MRFKIILTAFFFSALLQAQQQDIWTAFYNKDSTLIGYKDFRQHIQVPAKFGFTPAIRFKDIIGVSEKVNTSWKFYYLNKAGKQFGTDSLYITDNTADCENEGHIRFRDRKTDKAGMFNRHGKIVIPAAYNELSKAQNGMVAALVGAHKKYMHEDREKNGDNYFFWTGGRKLLIDTLNNTLIEDFSTDSFLNFYSVQHASKPSSDPIRINFKAVDGTYYSFTDFEKEFRLWLKQELLSGITQEKLTRLSWDLILWESQNGWTRTPRNSFMEKNYELLRKNLLEFYNPQADFHIFIEGLNPFLYEGPDFKPYFDNCNEGKSWKYPVISLVFTYNPGKDGTVQNHFDFLRTDNGYRLISVTTGTGTLKE